VNHRGLKLYGWTLTDPTTAVFSDGHTLLDNGLVDGVSEEWVGTIPPAIPEASMAIRLAAGRVVLGEMHRKRA